MELTTFTPNEVHVAGYYKMKATALMVERNHFIELYRKAEKQIEELKKEKQELEKKLERKIEILYNDQKQIVQENTKIQHQCFDKMEEMVTKSLYIINQGMKILANSNRVVSLTINNKYQAIDKLQSIRKQKKELKEHLSVVDKSLKDELDPRESEKLQKQKYDVKNTIDDHNSYENQLLKVIPTFSD